MLNTRNKQGRRTTITDLHSVYGLFESFILTKSGSLIGGLELSGRESDGFLHSDFLDQTKVLSHIYEKLPINITMTQCYIHHDGMKVALKRR